MNKHRLVYLNISNGSSPYPTDFDMNSANRRSLRIHVSQGFYPSSAC